MLHLSVFFILCIQDLEKEKERQEEGARLEEERRLEEEKLAEEERLREEEEKAARLKEEEEKRAKYEPTTWPVFRLEKNICMGIHLEAK